MMFLRKMLDLPEPDEPQGLAAGVARDFGIPIPQNAPSGDGSLFADAARTLGLMPPPSLYTRDFQPYPGSLGGVSLLALVGSSGAPFERTDQHDYDPGDLLTEAQQPAAPTTEGAQGTDPSEEDVRLLARLIFAEAADHWDVPGAMEGVGWIARNRIGAPGFRKTLPDVILKPGGFDGPKNPQWEKAGDPSKLTAKEARAYQRALEVARGVLSGDIPDPTGGATFFYSRKPNEPVPPWFEPRIANGRFVQVNEDRRFGDLFFLRDTTKK
jgi:spore germination cell wall hydrolase CwlJ-like protein